MEKKVEKTFYITTTLPYVNAEPHLGHAMEFVRADAVARYHRLLGEEVFFNTGTDEHGVKILGAAQKEGKPVKEYVDFYAEKFKGVLAALGISPDIHFVRTTDPSHEAAAQEFWRRCDQNGYIYKKDYEIKYCVGCELEKTDSELNDEGKCPIHPNREIDLIKEENYFFKFSAFEKPLLELYEKHPLFVIPDFRFNEIKAFVKRGLQDFSISRLKSKMPWGIPVPGDETQVMYVWFDALVNYISTLGWPENESNFKKFWAEGTPVQYCGKDNLRQQSAMWQAMLMAAKLSSTHTIVINGFITGVGGIKMSKSLGNVTNPLTLIEKYGTDALRYYVLREIPSFEDSPFSIERFHEAYNANLANGIGNLTSRIMKLAETHLGSPVAVPQNTIPNSFKREMERFDIKRAADIVWAEIAMLDAFIQEKAPFTLIKADKEKAVEIIKESVVRLYTIGWMLNPLLPETSRKIKELVKGNKMPEKPLFPRIES